MERLRVGIDFRGAQTSGERGIGRYATDLVLGLVDHAPEVEITLFVKPGPITELLTSRAKTVVVPANYWNGPSATRLMHLLHRPRLRRLHGAIFDISMRSQREAIDSAMSKYPQDILHIVSALDVGSYPIYDYPCPVVMTFLDAIVLRLKEITYDRFPSFLQDYFDAQAKNLLRADRIVAISEASKADAVSFFGLDPERTDVIYPAVSKEFAEPVLRPERLSALPFFLFCSAPDPHKNPETILRAFAQIPATHQLVFVSPGAHPAIPTLKRLAADLGFADRFSVTGFVEEAELRGLFQNAEAVVSPSLMEGFGLPVAQAMRAGTAVITSDRSAQAEIADGIGILIDPNSVEELLAAMNQVIQNPHSKPDKRAQERAKQFDSDVVTRQLLQTYQKAIKKSH